MIEETGDKLTLTVYERSGHSPAGVMLTVENDSHQLLRLEAEALTSVFEDSVSLADQALWAWGSGGLIGLQAYLMTRGDVWDHEA